MLTTTLRHSAPQKRMFTRLQQRRHGGSISKNKHIENWNNWRGDSEKRFQFDNKFFTSLAAWGLIPFSLCFIIASNERHKRGVRDGVPETFR